jgi:hypothetical protein
MIHEMKRPDPDTIPIPKAALEKILNYIATKPYLEAAPLINEVQQAIQIALQPKPPDGPVPRDAE